MLTRSWWIKAKLHPTAIWSEINHAACSSVITHTACKIQVLGSFSEQVTSITSGIKYLAPSDPVHCSPLSVNDCVFFLYGFGIQKCETNQFLFFLLLPNGKILNKMFLILAGYKALWNKCICSMLSSFDALALKSFAKEYGVKRHSISFAYYFVHNMLDIDK